MCYNECEFENRNGGCNKPVNKQCPDERINICTDNDIDCEWFKDELCIKQGACFFKKEVENK